MRTPIAKVPLSRGLFAIIDKSDLELVSRYKWYATTGKHIYAVTRLKGERNVISLSRFLTGAQPGCKVRFRNFNTLDNRRKNLFPTPPQGGAQ